MDKEQEMQTYMQEITKAATTTNDAHRLTLIKRRDNRKTKELIDEQTEVTSIVSTNRMMIMNSERRVKGASRATRIELKLATEACAPLFLSPSWNTHGSKRERGRRRGREELAVVASGGWL